MRLLADENFPEEAVAALRKKGHDVFWVLSDAPGIGDREVLRRAQAQGRILVTFDKDFGELAFRSGLPSSCGIVLFRIRAPSPAYVARAAAAAIEQELPWTGHFAVVQEHRIRMKPLPKRARH